MLPMNIRRYISLLYLLLFFSVSAVQPFAAKIVRFYKTNSYNPEQLDHDIYVVYDIHECGSDLKKCYKPLFLPWLKNVIRAAKLAQEYGPCNLFIEALTAPYIHYSDKKSFATLDDACKLIGQYHCFFHTFRILKNNEHLINHEPSQAALECADSQMRFIASLVGMQIARIDQSSFIDLLIEKWLGPVLNPIWSRLIGAPKGYSWKDFFNACDDIKNILSSGRSQQFFINNDNEIFEHFLEKVSGIRERLNHLKEYYALSNEYIEKEPIDRLYLQDAYNKKYGGEMLALVSDIFSIGEFSPHGGTTIIGMDYSSMCRLVDYTVLSNLLDGDLREEETRTDFVWMGLEHSEHICKVLRYKGYEELVLYEATDGEVMLSAPDEMMDCDTALIPADATQLIVE